MAVYALMYVDKYIVVYKNHLTLGVGKEGGEMDIKLTQDFLGVTEFRSVLRETIDRIEQTRRPLVLTKGGKPSAVVLDVQSYQDLCDALKNAELLSLVEGIKQAEVEVSTGRTRSHQEAVEELERRRKRRKHGS